MHWKSSFTLIETLIVISILAILAASALPCFTRLHHQYHLRTIRFHLKTAIDFSRTFAISHHEKITICPTANFETCINTWQPSHMSGLMIRQQDHLISTQLLPKSTLNAINMHFYGFGPTSYITVLPSGMILQNGHFYITTRTPPLCSIQLMIARSGRIQYQEH